MNRFLLGTTTLLFATVASADIPQLNYDCPTNIAVHADKGGPVFINGKEAKLKKFNDNAYEARGSGVAISLTRNPDESWDVSYTGKGGANGVCQPATSGAASASSTSGTSATNKAEKACLAEVAKQTGVAASKLSVTDVMTAEAGIGVTIKVPGADAPWSCLSNGSGKIQGASYTGSEGNL
ncbi:hypothetical protein B0D71_02900 [Pseudomonas laurylsulfativorans]|uniref:Uncharacterized protein n=1 Tax=Pseudomonas laurylsulfativorans TaxID=1943631 RepID=A0A2S3VWR6_9PSED|nr:hypothetical protein B0D71_02900 [Pseudomonas laurylsulfativorans]